MSCGGDAHFSQRLSLETGVEVIGGADKYQAVCRECFFQVSSDLDRKMQMVMQHSHATEVVMDESFSEEDMLATSSDE